MSVALDRDEAARAVFAPANDNHRPAYSPARPLPFVSPQEWDGSPVPKRQWFVEGVIPSRTVTLLSGDGGVGKSLLALQIGVAAALGGETIGLRPTHGCVIYLGAEDEQDEFHRRLHDIVRAQKRTLFDLDGFALVPMAGLDAVLAVPDRAGKMAETQVFVDLVELAVDVDPKLIVLDTSADLFGGDEIKRTHVRQFVGMLRGLAMTIDCAVILLSHPSVAGMQSGTGLSGSTAWNNSVRSRLYLDFETTGKGKEETGVVLLSTKKSNYGPRGFEARIRWQDGVFVQDDGAPSPAQTILDKKASEVFLAVLGTMTQQGQNLSPKPSSTYAPKLIAAHHDSQGIKQKQFEAAMQRLLGEGLVKIVEEGPPSKRRQRLLPASVVWNETPTDPPTDPPTNHSN